MVKTKLHSQIGNKYYDMVIHLDQLVLNMNGI